MACFWTHMHFTILFTIVVIQGTNCSLLSRSRNPSQYLLQPVFLPDDITDDMYNALIVQRPDLEPYLSVQRKTQLRRNQMPYLLKKKKKKQKAKYPFYDHYERNKTSSEVLLLENDDDDITRPLSDFDDGRRTEIINPLLVPEYNISLKNTKGSSVVDKKEDRLNISRRGPMYKGEDAAWNGAYKVANCYVCYAHETTISKINLCHTAFHSDDFRLRSQTRYFRSACYYNWDYRNSGYWKYKRYWWHGVEYEGSRGMTIHRLGSYTKGCMKRYADVGEVFTMRTCRGWWPHYMGGLMEHRMIRLELPITKEVLSMGG
ncbi:hypothetical protein HF086_015376 [Spodoptera exigua]|uniref:Uncharacterized protein n=1 Tax=Spodoptera exigua TaxID=7107 RepID=A0A922S832_SPOEX|nr:hypothetical protein HF086_015376 [Spodoptera exigua]